MGLPADASGAYRPNPQATTKLAPRPSSLKGYVFLLFFLDSPSAILIPSFRHPKAAPEMKETLFGRS
jgi:hypothetical protein